MLNPSALQLKQLIGKNGIEELRAYGLQQMVYIKKMKSTDGADFYGIFDVTGTMMDAHATAELATTVSRLHEIESTLVH